jgi:hypothetical protein
MPNTVGNHSVATFTSPSNGDALDASVVKGNDNSLRGSYVNHDADPGIHLQSSDLAGRPAAGTAGRKWMTTDTGSVRVWYDTGSAWEELLYATPSANTLSGSTLASGVTASSLTSVGTLTALTMGGTVSMADNVISRPRLTDYAETYTTPTISGGTLTLNLENGNVFRVSRNANISTLTISNPAGSGNACSFTLIFDANGTSYTITWPAAVKWPSGTAPTITTTNGRSDVFTFYTNNAGTTWYAMTAAQNLVTT